MNDNAFYILVIIIVSAIIYSSLTAVGNYYLNKQRRAWRNRKIKTLNSEVI